MHINRGTTPLASTLQPSSPSYNSSHSADNANLAFTPASHTIILHQAEFKPEGDAASKP
uniref:Uncharacterized protein n=1 Tax=Arundo donax TaxID=35708 RepID=A0A0A8ZX82_ARUDO